MPKLKQKNISVPLWEQSILNKKLIEELDSLFDVCPPHILRRSVNEIFWAYLCNTDHEDLKPEIKEIAMDFNCLIRFLEIAEMYENEKEESRKRAGNRARVRG